MAKEKTPADAGTSLAMVPASEAAQLTQPGPGELPYFVRPEEAIQVWSSLPHSQLPTIVMAMQGGTAKQVGDCIGDTIKVRDVVAHRIQVVDTDTGELIDADRIILLSESGEMYAAVSVGMRKSLQVLMQFFGMPTWTPALTVQIRQVNTKRGFRTYTLIPQDNPDDWKAARAKAAGK